MFDKFFEEYPDYVSVRKPDDNVVNGFSSRLPVQLIEFWSAYGFGMFMDGYLKVIDPSEFQAVFNEAYDNNGNEIVFGVTAFGDFLAWTGDAIRAVYFKNGYDSIIESGDDLEWFFDMDLTEQGFLRDNLNDKNYLAAKERLGELEYDECYGYVPLLGLGGTEKVENLQRVRIKEHVSMIAQTLGRIE